ncbi:CLUMA_CG016790, isoform A [Clunio marinus]|uniref:CLUMA_CG016790, isoform A n=1 Tax=Clunio marinus TaxID=568069 RepID=A0A1J1IUP3_9DIPT|nr:CLUMA_CG016790, isoform A [Clunio marinus]
MLTRRELRIGVWSKVERSSRILCLIALLSYSLAFTLTLPSTLSSLDQLVCEYFAMYKLASHLHIRFAI